MNRNMISMFSQFIILMAFVLQLVACDQGPASPAPTASYKTTVDGQRISETVDGEQELFIYDLSGRLIAKTDADGNTLVEYIYLNGEQLAMVSDTGTAEEAIHYVHTDHLGTPEVLSDDKGAEVWRRNQTPFGETVEITGDVVQDTRFLGQRYNEETGYHYNYARDYDPSLGRYLQSDPLGIVGGANTYSYALQNPVAYADPYGEHPLLIAYYLYKAGSAAYGAYDTFQVLMDDCASTGDKLFAFGSTVAGAISPTGGSGAFIGKFLGKSSSKVTKHSDGSYRTPDGKFASKSGVAAPGTKKSSDFAEHLRSNGMDVVGEELTVKGPLGKRRLDIVTRDANGNLHGIEVKSGGASKTPYQRFTDQFINRFGAQGTGSIEGQKVKSVNTVYLP